MSTNVNELQEIKKEVLRKIIKVLNKKLSLANNGFLQIADLLEEANLTPREEVNEEARHERLASEIKEEYENHYQSLKSKKTIEEVRHYEEDFCKKIEKERSDFVNKIVDMMDKNPSLKNQLERENPSAFKIYKQKIITTTKDINGEEKKKIEYRDGSIFNLSFDNEKWNLEAIIIGNSIRKIKKCVVCFQLLNPNEQNLHEECLNNYVIRVLKDSNIDTDKIGDSEWEEKLENIATSWSTREIQELLDKLSLYLLDPRTNEENLVMGDNFNNILESLIYRLISIAEDTHKKEVDFSEKDEDKKEKEERRNSAEILLKVFQEGGGYCNKIYDSLSTKEELKPCWLVVEAIKDPKGKIDKIIRES